MQHHAGTIFTMQEDSDAHVEDLSAEGIEGRFIENMRQLRVQQGMSQTEFARRVSERGPRFHQPTVQRIERGERAVRLSEAFAIADVLDMDMMDLSMSGGREVPRRLLQQVLDGSDAELRAIVDLVQEARSRAEAYPRLIAEVGDAYRRSLEDRGGPDLPGRAVQVHRLDEVLLGSADALVEYWTIVAEHLTRLQMRVKVEFGPPKQAGAPRQDGGPSDGEHQEAP